MIELKLPKKQQRLYDRLRSGEDVPIVDLYLTLGLNAERAQERDEKSRSYAQSCVIAYITRTNRRLVKHNLVIHPGRTKHTYCLSPTT